MMKMRQFKYIIMLAFIGIGIGSFFSLLSITLSQAIFSLTQFALLMTMSAIMGILSIIFDYDKFSFMTQLVLHFVLEMLTYLIFIALTFGKTSIALTNIPTFVIIYLAIFLYMRQQGHDNARRINEQLADKKHS